MFCFIYLVPQGETLASGTRGSPWRLEIDKATSKVDTLAFANFSHALVVPSGADGRGTGSTTALRYNAFEDTLGGAAGSAVRVRLPALVFWRVVCLCLPITYPSACIPLYAFLLLLHALAKCCCLVAVAHAQVHAHALYCAALCALLTACGR